MIVLAVDTQGDLELDLKTAKAEGTRCGAVVYDRCGYVRLLALGDADQPRAN